MKKKIKLFDILLKVSELEMDVETAESLIRNHFRKKSTKDYKVKYEKCIDVIKRFDAGIIGMYDL